MKVIDLYNMAVQGVIPKKIKMNNKIFIYNENNDDWLDGDDYGILDLKNTIDGLTHTVEIIEEEKEIEELPIIKNADNTTSLQGKDFNYTMETVDVILANKINEIVRKLNNLSKCQK